MIQASKSQKRDFRHFSGAKVCYSHGNVRFESFMYMEWSEEKFLKGIVGDKRRLHFWNKHQKIELLFTQPARYNRTHRRVSKYQKIIPGNLANKSNLWRHKVDILFFLLEYIYSSLAAWAKDLSSETCFGIIAWFDDPHCLWKTSPHSTQCAWNSRFWN